MWAIYGSLILMIATIIYMPRGNKKTQQTDILPGSSIKFLMKNTDFIWFLLVVGLLQMSHGVYYSMGSIYWKENGINEDIIGLLWAVGVIAEILLFIFCNNIIKKYPVFMIFAFIGLTGTVRWAIFAMSFSLPILFFTQILHALTFGLAIWQLFIIWQKILIQNVGGTAQSLYSCTTARAWYGIIDLYWRGHL